MRTGRAVALMLWSVSMAGIVPVQMYEQPLAKADVVLCRTRISDSLPHFLTHPANEVNNRFREISPVNLPILVCLWFDPSSAQVARGAIQEALQGIRYVAAAMISLNGAWSSWWRETRAYRTTPVASTTNDAGRAMWIPSYLTGA
jgi:hypothetical protein